ncbi:helix-turn-helix transcriptional regulator [Candidatus Dojkabacteria bacterium]|uniref:Helix-turn-helix transcriptional regulator n=1 Tax=Candidatus Dojkabacteria bacterium TaxID=2099670 RepID=A0A955RKC9_9BACT|nr:helix-turn-helix transcriptional regulator [Candidatus Dojkabacteria bacterium]
MVKALGKNIRSIRTNKKMSRKELAEKAGISVFAVIDVELGRIKSPLFTTIANIADVLGVTIDELRK